MGELAKTISNWQNNIFNSANCFTPSFLRRFYEESTPGIILVSRYMHDKKSQIWILENISIMRTNGAHFIYMLMKIIRKVQFELHTIIPMVVIQSIMYLHLKYHQWYWSELFRQNWKSISIWQVGSLRWFIMKLFKSLHYRLTIENGGVNWFAILFLVWKIKFLKIRFIDLYNKELF